MHENVDKFSLAQCNSPNVYMCVCELWAKNALERHHSSANGQMWFLHWNRVELNGMSFSVLYVWIQTIFGYMREERRKDSHSFYIWHSLLKQVVQLNFVPGQLTNIPLLRLCAGINLLLCSHIINAWKITIQPYVYYALQMNTCYRLVSFQWENLKRLSSVVCRLYERKNIGHKILGI